MEQAFFLSVIIPVYNAGDFLQKCLDSLNISQHPELQVILVNDGSKDQSDEICRFYQERFTKQIVYIKKQNQGVSAARNDGIRYAQGIYTAFLDADDQVMPGYVSSVQEMCKMEAQLFVYSYRQGTDMEHAQTINISWNEGIYRNDAALCDTIFTDLKYQAWNKVFLTKLIQEHQLAFDTTMRWSEDLDFWVRYLRYVNQIYVSEKELYFYRLNPNGAVANVKPECLDATTKALQHQVEFLIDRNAQPHAYRSLVQHYTEHMTQAIYHCICRGADIGEVKEKMRILKGLEVLRYKPFSLSARFKWICMKHKWICLLKLYFQLRNGKNSSK